MKKSKNKVKIEITCIILLIVAINVQAAIVSDNDGSAFVTKAEFESLKENFNGQIDNYNTSIDKKIDGAIASYLAGIRLTKKEPIANKYVTFKTATNQFLRLLKWDKSNEYCLNEAVSSTGDRQNVYQNIQWYFSNMGNNQTSGYQTLVGPTENTTKENRIEVGKLNNIKYWGLYQPIVRCVSELDYYSNSGYGTSIFGWAPIQTSTFEPVMRKERGVGRSYRTKYGSSTNWYFEYNFIKYNETLPSDLRTLNMDMIRIAPLSTKNEGTIPPAPGVNDADFDYDNANYGENKFGSGAQTEITALDTTVYTRTNDIWIPASNIAGAGGRIYVDLIAKWFRVRKYNELSFDVIDEIYGFPCPMKSGLPVSDKTIFKAEDKVKVTVENPTTNGYLIPYVSEAPSDTWNGAKSTYTSGTKYRVTAGNKKEIEIDINTKMNDGVVFVVWLPDTASVMPTLTIEQEKVS